MTFEEFVVPLIALAIVAVIGLAVIGLAVTVGANTCGVSSHGSDLTRLDATVARQTDEIKRHIDTRHRVLSQGIDALGRKQARGVARPSEHLGY